MKRMPKEEIIYKYAKEYTHQYCSYCGHTNSFNQTQDYKICTWCGKKIYNRTKSRFMKIMIDKCIDLDKYKKVKL